LQTQVIAELVLALPCLL